MIETPEGAFQNVVRLPGFTKLILDLKTPPKRLATFKSIF